MSNSSRCIASGGSSPAARDGLTPLRAVADTPRDMHPNALRPLLVSLLLAPIVACAHGKAEGGAAQFTGSDSAEADPSRPSAKAGEWTRGFDLNRDGKPDVFDHYVKNADGTDRLVRKDLDINMDGKIDVWRSYDEKERLKKEAVDLDFDGRVDVVNIYDPEGKLVRKESDLQFDGKPDVFKYYEQGKLVRKEVDTNGDGRIDYYEYYEDGKIDRVGEDLDGDGSVDRWTKAQK